MSVYARPDVVKECLSPPTSSSCRCKALVHRGGTHLARPFTCEGLANQTSTHTVVDLKLLYPAPLSQLTALLTSRFKKSEIIGAIVVRDMSNKLHGLLCSVANSDSRTGTGRVYTNSIMIHSYIHS